METVLPPFGSVPANDTTPFAGARTGVPLGAPMSIPRCCPTAYGWSGSNENGRRTGPSTGHVHARAAAVGSATAHKLTRTAKRRTRLLLVVRIENSPTVARSHARCQYWLQSTAVEGGPPPPPP